MADLQQGRQVVVDRLKRRINQYRVEHNSRGSHLETTFQAAYETEHKRTLTLNQRQIESKNKKSNSKKEKKLEQPSLTSMGQSKTLARCHDSGADDGTENPAKKPRLSGPAHLMNPSGASSSCGTGPFVTNHSNANNTMAPSSAGVAASASAASAMGNGPNVDISEFQMVQQLQNLKKSDSPAPHMSGAGNDCGSNSMTSNLLDTNLLCPLLDDIKKEDGMGGEMPELSNDLFGDLSNFDGMDLTEIDFDMELLTDKPDDSNASGFSLGNDYDALNIGGQENGEATSVGSNDVGAVTNSTSPSLQQQTQPQQQLPTVQQSTPSSTPSSVSVPSPAPFGHQYNNQQPPVSIPLTQTQSPFPSSSSGLTSSASSTFQNTHSSMQKVRGVGGLPPGMGGMPPQGGDSPAATTLKNMAQVHQKQHIGPVGPNRPQTFNDFSPYSSMNNSQVMGQNGSSHQMYPQGMNPSQSLFNNQSPSSLSEVELKKRHMMHMQHQQQLASSGMQMQPQQSQQQQQLNPTHSQSSSVHPNQQQQQQIPCAPSMQQQQQQQQQPSPMSTPSSQITAQISSGVSCGVTNSSSTINTLTSTPHSIPKAPTPSHMHQQHLNPQLAAQQQQQQHMSQQQAQMAGGQQQGGLAQQPQQQQHTQPQGGGSLQSQQQQQQQQLLHSSSGGPAQPNGPQQNAAHTPSNTGSVSGAPNSVLSQSAVSVGGDPQINMQQHQMHMQQIMPMQQQGGGGGPGGMMAGMQGFSRMSPMGTYPGQPGAGAMGQYGAMRGPGGVRPPYHRPSSLSPGAQMAMGADGKMTPQEMFYPSPMGQQFSGMNPGQPPRYPNQMIGPGMMRAMSSSQQHQIMVNQGGQMLPRPPPPEYRHATTIMQQQQMMAQPMPQAMGQGMGQMVYPSMRPGLRPGIGGGSMVSISNGATAPSSMMGAGGPSPSNPPNMGQQPQNLPPSLPAMKPGGASGPVSSPAPTTSLPSSLAMPHPSQASSMAGTMTSPASMPVVGQGSMAGSQGAVAGRAAMMQRSCPPNVNVGPTGLVSSQMQQTRPEWSHMMMTQRGQTAGMMMRPTGYPGHPHQQQQGGIMTANSQMMGMQRGSSQMMPMMAMSGGAAAMPGGMQGPMPGAAMQPGMAGGIQGPGMVASGMNPGSRMQPGMTGPMGSGQVRMGLQMSQSGGGMGGAQVTPQYPGQGAQMNAMGQMGGLQGSAASPMVPTNQMQGAGGPPHMMGGVVPGARNAGVGGMPSARSPAGMVQMNGGQNHPMSPANMGNMGGSSPASMGGMGQAHSPASMGGMNHPRSPAAMMQHPRSPATMGGSGRPLSNPSMGHSASGGTTPNMLPDVGAATSGPRSNPPSSIANKGNPAVPSSSCSSLSAPNSNASGAPGSQQQQQRPPSAGRTSQPPTPNPPTTSNSSPHNNPSNVTNPKNPSNNNTQQQIDHLDINSYFNAPQDFASLLEEHN